MLASLLFPYDDDAGDKLPKWIAELENEGCIRLYEVAGSRYMQIVGWSKHQKIDKPSKPQFPAPPDDTLESSRDTRERSSEEGKGREGIKDQGREEETEPEGSGASLELEPPPDGKPDRIPYQAIVDAFNATMKNLAKVRELTPKRRTLIRTAWNASPDRRSLPFWTKGYFAECQDDDFLNGTGPYRNGHENWRPSFDYLLKSDVVTRVFERAMDRLERGDNA
jgi:hypothetical protein